MPHEWVWAGSWTRPVCWTADPELVPVSLKKDVLWVTLGKNQAMNTVGSKVCGHHPRFCALLYSIHALTSYLAWREIWLLQHATIAVIVLTVLFLFPLDNSECTKRVKDGVFWGWGWENRTGQWPQPQPTPSGWTIAKNITDALVVDWEHLGYMSLHNKLNYLINFASPFLSLCLWAIPVWQSCS